MHPQETLRAESATDQTAGIVFNLKPDGSYTYARYNTKDGNVAIWKFENGARTVLKHGEAHEQLPPNTWQTLTVTITGAEVSASAHGGRLWATGNEGRGSCFHFTLPALDTTGATFYRATRSQLDLGPMRARQTSSDTGR